MIKTHKNIFKIKLAIIHILQIYLKTNICKLKFVMLGNNIMVVNKTIFHLNI